MSAVALSVLQRRQLPRSPASQRQPLIVPSAVRLSSRRQPLHFPLSSVVSFPALRRLSVDLLLCRVQFGSALDVSLCTFRSSGSSASLHSGVSQWSRAVLSATLFTPFPPIRSLPAVGFGVGCAPGDSRPGPGELCSIRPPSAGHSGLDVDANHTALTPRPRLSSPCVLPIALHRLSLACCVPGLRGAYRLKVGGRHKPEYSFAVIPRYRV
jgi:hypothetical protein